MLPTNSITALKKGEYFIFEEVFEEYYERIYFYLLKKTKAEYIAEEATQLTFIKLWKYRDRLDESIDLNIQLFQIARTTLIDLLRKKRNKEIHLTKSVAHQRLSSNDVWEKVSAQELNRRLVLSLQTMPAVRRKVFEMSRIREMSNKEIASRLSISVKAVEYHITQAIKYLRHILAFIIFFSSCLG
ncbi:MAG TPA: sigma-70 family RNA polymerase sigma factor [Flavisolibacter sp.]|nr:sigma-70 family RNA polymerase sigma factor [Flavisolibacter sp.]